MVKQIVRVRIAPSPTGYPHIGTIYQALFNYAYAKKNQGQFIIRIEDTDRERFVEDAEQKIYHAIDWFSLQEDESPRKEGKYKPYRQSERLPLYKQYVDELIQKGYAYYCFCSKERLEQVRHTLQQEKKPIMYDKHCLKLSKAQVQSQLQANVSYVVRLNIPKDQQIVVKDEIRGEITFDSNTIDDQVLLKSDGFPTYHLAVVVDDHLMGITHVVRGEEWLPSTPKHVLLYQYFGWPKPLFFHTPTLRNPDKSKLSKRHGHTNVMWYQENGYLPEAILNFLALMGWGHPEGKEIFTLDEFISLVELSDIKAVGPIFDLQKLTWMNGNYIREKNDAELKKMLQGFYNAYDKEFLSFFDNKHIDIYINLAKTRMKTLKDFKTLVTKEEIPYKYTEDDKKLAGKLHSALQEVSEEQWENTILLNTLKKFQKEQNVSMKKIYTLLTGKEQGLPLLEKMIMIDGREKTLKNILDTSNDKINS